MIHERIGWLLDSKTHEGAGRPGSIRVFPMKNAAIIALFMRIMQHLLRWKTETNRKPLLVSCPGLKHLGFTPFPSKNVGENIDGGTHIYSLPLYELFRLKEYFQR